MGVIKCAHCGQDFDDQELLCPHCGTAQIPQMSKAELRMKMLRTSAGPYGVSLVGTGIGLLIGLIVLIIAILRDEATLQHGAGMLLGGMLGGAIGLFVFYYFLADRK
jgi:hypothetical protein